MSPEPVAIHLPELSSRFSAHLTIAHLLSHTSGLSDFLQPQFLPQLAPATNNSDVYKFVVGLEPLEEPGGRMRYTNANFVVLGELIERLTNTSFEQHIEDAILKPAGMQSTRFIHGGDRDAGPIAINYMDVPAERAFAMMTDREAQQEFASRSEANHKMDEFVHEAPLFGDGMVANGSGGMYATAADLLRFTAALCNETLLPWEELLALCKPKSPARRSGRAYGLGCESRYAGTAKESIGHGGSSFGMQAYMVMYPESGLDVVILSNHDRQADPLIDSVGDAMSED